MNIPYTTLTESDLAEKILMLLESLNFKDLLDLGSLVLLFILIVITYYYARSTDKMRKLIQRQVVPDVKLEVIEFRSEERRVGKECRL